MRKLAILFLYLFISTSTFGQSIDSTNTTETYIRSYSDLVTISPNIHNNIETFVLRTPGYNLELYPNTNVSTSLKISYDFLVFSISTSPAFLKINNDENLRGETKTIHYATNLRLGHRLNQNLFYQRTKGYYLNNTTDFVPDWTPDQSYITIPDLLFTSLGGTTTFFTNKNYSLFAFTAINQKQVKSSGSMIFDLSYQYYKIDNQTPLVEVSSSQRSDNLELIFTAGYNYTLVLHENMILASGLSLGGGVTRTKLTTRFPDTRIKSYDNTPILTGKSYLSIGFDNGRYFTGATVTGLRNEHLQSNDAVYFDNRLSYELYFGYRFNAPKAFEKAANKIKSFLPFI